jgi:hypothetical protein
MEGLGDVLKLFNNFRWFDKSRAKGDQNSIEHRAKSEGPDVRGQMSGVSSVPELEGAEVRSQTFKRNGFGLLSILPSMDPIPWHSTESREWSSVER